MVVRGGFVKVRGGEKADAILFFYFSQVEPYLYSVAQ